MIILKVISVVVPCYHKYFLQIFVEILKTLLYKSVQDVLFALNVKLVLSCLDAELKLSLLFH